MRCDVIAEGIIAAAELLNLKIPIVCRLQGLFDNLKNLFFIASLVQDISFYSFSSLTFCK